MRYCYSN